MRVVWAALVVAALFGCDLSRSTGPTGSSVVTGIIQLPSGTDTGVCSRIDVSAALGTGQHIGRTAVHASHARCSYEIIGLPAGKELSVTVQSPGWQCKSGAAPGFAPSPAAVNLKDDETRMVDFRASCG